MARKSDSGSRVARFTGPAERTCDRMLGQGLLAAADITGRKVRRFSTLYEIPCQFLQIERNGYGCGFVPVSR